jgi:hypothetical protein
LLMIDRPVNQQTYGDRQSILEFNMIYLELFTTDACY